MIPIKLDPSCDWLCDFIILYKKNKKYRKIKENKKNKRIRKNKRK